VFYYRLEEPILHSPWAVVEGFLGYRPISPAAQRINENKNVRYFLKHKHRRPNQCIWSHFRKGKLDC